MKDTIITSKFKHNQFTLTEINEKLESVNATLVIEADDKDGKFVDAYIRDGMGFAADVVSRVTDKVVEDA